MNTTIPIAIQCVDIGKRYVIHHDKPTLTDRLARGGNETFWALRHVNMTIRTGEKIGIVGPNGSGKTTLLKIITGITTPTEGTIRASGRVVSLIDLEAGFHPDLNGRDNIRINGMLIGMTRDEIKREMKRIVAFSGLGTFIDAPMYTYSSGMRLRLGFSVAVHADPDILIVDEGLHVGDERFRKKAVEKLDELKRSNMTYVLASHVGMYIHKWCDRIIWLEKGKIRMDGNLAVLAKYHAYMQR